MLDIEKIGFFLNGYLEFPYWTMKELMPGHAQKKDGIEFKKVDYLDPYAIK